jgi:Transposase IS4
MQERFAAHFVPEQNLSHDEAMIKYFGKHGLKQAIRNKPIRFGFKAWVLATVSGYVAAFDIYQGKGLGQNHDENVAAVGVAGATLLDLVDLLPEEKKELPYHFFADNYFTSMKLVDELSNSGYSYTGTIRKDRVKGNPPLTAVEAFKKKDRGYHETAVLEDKSQIIVRWNDNAPVTMLSNALGNEPIGSCKRYCRKDKKHVKVPMPDIVGKYNPNMGGVDRFDQNINHLRISIGGKKWYHTLITWNLDTAVQNAWQLHRKAGGTMSSLDFRREIVCNILMNAAADKRSKSKTVSLGRLSTPGSEEIRFDNQGHYVTVRRNVRRQCAMDMCTTKCQTYCIKCDRALCCDCFMEYHVLNPKKS